MIAAPGSTKRAENAGAEVVFEGDETTDLVIDGNLISAKHPAATQKFMEAFVEAIERAPETRTAKAV